mgnify:CR=1 FL=1
MEAGTVREYEPEWTAFMTQPVPSQLAGLARLLVLLKQQDVISATTSEGKEFLALLPFYLSGIAFRMSGKNARDILPNPPKPKRRVRQPTKE